MASDRERTRLYEQALMASNEAWGHEAGRNFGLAEAAEQQARAYHLAADRAGGMKSFDGRVMDNEISRQAMRLDRMVRVGFTGVATILTLGGIGAVFWFLS